MGLAAAHMTTSGLFKSTGLLSDIGSFGTTLLQREGKGPNKLALDQARAYSRASKRAFDRINEIYCNWPAGVLTELVAEPVKRCKTVGAHDCDKGNFRGIARLISAIDKTISLHS